MPAIPERPAAPAAPPAPPAPSAPPAPPKGRFLTRAPLELAPLLTAVADPACGAQAVFLGTVRNRNDGREVVAIEYSAYSAMAESVLERIVRELERATPDLRLVLRHRIGELAVGEAAIAIVAASPRRDAALGAIRAALERVKSEAPIWKREIYADGSTGWREIEALGPHVAGPDPPDPGEESPVRAEPLELRPKGGGPDRRAGA